MPLTRADLRAAGLRVGELAVILGVHRTAISDVLSGVTARPTPGAQAVVWLWPQLSESQKAALLAGEQFVDPDPDSAA